MDETASWKKKIFELKNDKDFLFLAMEIFRYQAEHNVVYSEYLKLIGSEVDRISSLEKIPFLSVEFFKNHEIVSGNSEISVVFESSGTTGYQPSRHYILDQELYKASFTEGFELF